MDGDLQWLHRSTRTHLMVPYTNTPAGEGGEVDIADAFDEAQRVDKQVHRAPLNRYVSQQLSNYSEEANRQLFRTRDDKSNPLRSFVKKIKKGCKKLAAKQNCVDTTYEPPLNPMLSRSQTASMSTRAASASDTRATSSSVRTPQYTGKGPADEDDEDEDLSRLVLRNDTLEDPRAAVQRLRPSLPPS